MLNGLQLQVLSLLRISKMHKVKFYHLLLAVNSKLPDLFLAHYYSERLSALQQDHLYFTLNADKKQSKITLIHN